MRFGMPWFRRKGVVASAALILNKAVATTAAAGAAVLAARALGSEGRGLLALQITLVSLSMSLLATSVSLAGRLHLVSPHDPVHTEHYVGLATVVVVVQGFACLLIGLVLLPLANADQTVRSLLILELYGLLVVAASLSTGMLFAFGQFVAAGALQSSTAIVTCVATAVLLAVGSQDEVWYLTAFAIGAGGEVLAGLAVHLRSGRRMRPRFNGGAWRRLLRTGLPATGLGVAQSATYRLDRYIVGLFLAPAAVGVYAVAGTITELMRLVPFAIGQVLVHRVASKRLAEDFQRRVHTLTIAVAIATAAVIALVAPYLIPRLFGEGFAGAVTPLRILLLGEVAVSSFLINSSILMGRGQMRAAATGAVVALVVVTALDLALIPTYELAGAAWASVVGYWVMAVISRRQVRTAPPPEVTSAARISASPDT